MAKKEKQVTITITVDDNEVAEQLPHTVILLDRSGSMSSIREGTIAGINNFIDKAQKEGEGLFSLITFDDRDPYEKVFYRVNLRDAKHLTDETFVPRGNTPLYDAAVQTLKELEENTPKDQAVLVAIMTDGLENASRTHSEKDLQDIVKRLQDKGNFTIVYLGANQDSWGVARRFGSSRGNVANYVATNQGAAQSLNNVTENYYQWNRNARRYGSSRGMAGSLATMDFLNPKEEKEEEKEPEKAPSK